MNTKIKVCVGYVVGGEPLSLPDGEYIVTAQQPEGEAQESANMAAVFADEVLDAVMKERDEAIDMADQLADQIAAMTDSDIGEHSSSNCPHRAALIAADDFILAKAKREIFTAPVAKPEGEAVPAKVKSVDAPQRYFYLIEYGLGVMRKAEHGSYVGYEEMLAWHDSKMAEVLAKHERSLLCQTLRHDYEKQRAEKAEAERDQWKAQHADMVKRCALLRERDDLPVDRIPAYQELVRLQSLAAQVPQAWFPERDGSKPAEQQGLFRKFDVRRLDGSDTRGGKHYGCRYFVLDMDHDVHAPAALAAYGVSCAASHPQLSADLLAEFPQQAGQAVDAHMPAAYLRFRTAQNWDGRGDIEYDEWLEVCDKGDIGDDKLPAFAVYAEPVLVADWLGENLMKTLRKLHAKAANIHRKEAMKGPVHGASFSWPEPDLSMSPEEWIAFSDAADRLIREYKMESDLTDSMGRLI